MHILSLTVQNRVYSRSLFIHSSSWYTRHNADIDHSKIFESDYQHPVFPKSFHGMALDGKHYGVHRRAGVHGSVEEEEGRINSGVVYVIWYTLLENTRPSLS